MLVLGSWLISPWYSIYASAIWASFGSANGLSPVRRQAITWTNADLLSIGPLGTNFSEIEFKIQNVSFIKKHLKISSDKIAAILSRGEFMWYIYLQDCFHGIGRIVWFPQYHEVILKDIWKIAQLYQRLLLYMMNDLGQLTNVEMFLCWSVTILEAGSRYEEILSLLLWFVWVSASSIWAALLALGRPYAYHE